MSFAHDDDRPGQEDVTAEDARWATTSSAREDQFSINAQNSNHGLVPSVTRSDTQSSSSSSARRRQSDNPETTGIASIDFVSNSLGAKLREDSEAVRQLNQGRRISIDGSARFPKYEDFLPPLDMIILDPTDEPVEHCVILLHDIANNEKHLQHLAKCLQKHHAQIAFILLRGPCALGNHRYDWADTEREGDESFIHASRIVLESVIRDVLINKCNFHPRNVVILGRGQGGMAALAAAASWTEIEFGGVVSIGGPLPTYIREDRSPKAKTPTLFLRDSLMGIDDVALRDIEATFIHSDNDILSEEPLLASSEHLRPLLQFFAHRLRQDEWTKQAVISFGTILLRI